MYKIYVESLIYNFSRHYNILTNYEPSLKSQLKHYLFNCEVLVSIYIDPACLLPLHLKHEFY